MIKNLCIFALLCGPILAQQDRPVRYFPYDPTGGAGAACSVITPLWNNWAAGNLFKCVGAPGVSNGIWVLIGGGNPAFSAILGGTNTGQGMVVGNGSALSVSGTGIIDANRLKGADITPLTGVVKFAAGVPSVVPGTGTNCVLVNGTSSGCGGSSQVCVMTQTSSTVVTLGAAASATNPCNLNGVSRTSPITFTVVANGGTLRVYASGTSLIGGYGGGTFANGNVTCSGCTATTFGITAFPATTDGTVPIATWTATAGTWDNSGLTKNLDEASQINFVAGANITLTKTAGTLQVDATSSSSFYACTKTASSIAMTGSEVALTSACTVPALAAEGCYGISYVASNQTSLTITSISVKVGSTVISTVGGGTTPIQGAEFLYCNVTGSQTAQVTIAPEPLFYDTSGLRTNSTFHAGTDSIGTPTGVNWAVPNNIQLFGNLTTGTLSAAALHVGSR